MYVVCKLFKSGGLGKSASTNLGSIPISEWITIELHITLIY